MSPSRRTGNVSGKRRRMRPRGARGAVAHGEGCERGAKVLRRQFCGGVSYSRRLRDGFPSPLNPKSFSFFRNTLWQIELF